MFVSVSVSLSVCLSLCLSLCSLCDTSASVFFSLSLLGTSRAFSLDVALRTATQFLTANSVSVSVSLCLFLSLRYLKDVLLGRGLAHCNTVLDGKLQPLVHLRETEKKEKKERKKVSERGTRKVWKTKGERRRKAT
jgi:hypothetical protein